MNVLIEKTMIAFVSLVLGIFVYPWHNLPNTYEEIEVVGIDSMVTLRKKKKPLIRKDGDSLLTQFKQNSSYLKSPVFLGADSYLYIEVNWGSMDKTKTSSVVQSQATVHESI